MTRPGANPAKSAPSEAQLRHQILELVGLYAELHHGDKPFIAGQSPVKASGRVYGPEEMESLVDSALDFWLTTGRFNDAFESKLSEFLGARHVLTANSGSSANLLAAAALTSPMLKDRALKPGDEVIGVAAAFPTTVNPLLLYGLVPVFVDIKIPTYNIDASRLEAAVTPKTKAIMLAHTLGNPFDLGAVMKVAQKHQLWVVEDCCDALGATYQGKKVGTFGDIGTLSFYPAHHITMGEGGAVFTKDASFKKILESLRDWGRDCWCDPGKENTCGKRFGWQLGSLPQGYDHKYIYSHLGYNLKITDMQAAVGLAQLDRLPEFVEKRKANFQFLKKRLATLEDVFILPEATPGSDPSWFGFPITIREKTPIRRAELMHHLDEKKIGSRLLFAGNITRQPYFAGRPHRVAGELKNTDAVMERTFWIGVYPGLGKPQLEYAAEILEAYVRARMKEA
ncbi:MAG: lipopolysaccharide biosynthesis protein RfbH [Elusimicrobia bacterium]|nr:lipopolysaccharide biosynthesis protein RfbH [Elusimicrobiota bacterium]